MVENFFDLNLKDNEIYLLGDFNINLFQNVKYILNGKRSTTSQGSVHTMINRYQEFRQIYSLRYYAAFKVRKFESFFCKISTCLQKTTTCIGLQAEQIFSVNI